ncbi:MAG: tRNA (adenosine(37)-N6)-dimethylallyltransferase MiaA [Chloroflexota bacterium]|nr:tRNA (adenosine(37)-N6)-dimethylallyltransferase MiaA [Chloroflexota bacterium]
MTADTILKVNGSGNQLAHSAEPELPPLLVIVGPTASGKTGLAIGLADYLPIEIVNADSRAFYRGMDVGTAKPSEAERQRVVHHLVDIMEPDVPMSASLFQRLALETIGSIHDRGHVPALVGGTPQYVNALVEGWRIPQVPPNHDRRRELERDAETVGVTPLLERLTAVDPEGATRTGPNLRRIIRALEVFEATGVPFSQLRGRDDVPFRPLEFELWVPRKVLYRRIDARVDRMIEDGLVEEVRGLLAKGYDPALPAFSSIGYRQLMPAIAAGGDLGLGDSIERIKLDTHRLVRHQQTWFRKNDRLIRIDMTQADASARVVERSIAHCAGFLERERDDG